MDIRIGFAKQIITPPPGIELGGYAGYRPCAGAHDPLWCKAVVLQQENRRWALLAFDLLSIDESLSNRIGEAVANLGIEAVICVAIHSHAAPCGIVLDEGPLAEVNRVSQSDPESFRDYTQTIIAFAAEACRDACTRLEPFRVRCARGPAPVIGSERHTAEPTDAPMTVVQILTESGRSLILYQIPCHPTVLGPENLQPSADFVAGIEGRLDCDMALFLNGAAGDISTRFTRKAQTFEECDRLAFLSAESVKNLIRDVPYGPAAASAALRAKISLEPRPLTSTGEAAKMLEEAVARWEAGKQSGMAPGELRILRTYVEGAGVALEYAKTMTGIETLQLPVTVFTFAGLQFATVPGEMFSSLWHLDAVPICYANGYYRYIADTNAYDQGYYEATAAILARGQGEVFIEQTARLLAQLSFRRY